MHGFNQGAALLLELGLSADVIFCQEHWLLTSQLYQLDDMLEDFHFISVSAMDDNCGKGVLGGRPYCGLAFGLPCFDQYILRKIFAYLEKARFSWIKSYIKVCAVGGTDIQHLL